MPDSPQEPSIRPPHPLALALIERLHAFPGASILEIGTGSGRNAAALTRAGFAVHATRDYHDLPHDEMQRFSGALSTHALLHGTTAQIGVALRAIAAQLTVDAPLHAAFGSIKDARFGKGIQSDESTFAPTDGDERGIPHTFFDKARLLALLQKNYDVKSIEEHQVDEIAGTWAHREQPLHAAMHWFAIVTRL